MKNFGKKAKDKITGFEGIITARADYMYGCKQYLLVPPIDEKGNRREGEWFDEGRLDIEQPIIKPESVKVKKNGCEKREYPTRN